VDAATALNPVPLPLSAKSADIEVTTVQPRCCVELNGGRAVAPVLKVEFAGEDVGEALAASHAGLRAVGCVDVVAGSGTLQAADDSAGTAAASSGD